MHGQCQRNSDVPRLPRISASKLNARQDLGFGRLTLKLLGWNAANRRPDNEHCPNQIFTPSATQRISHRRSSSMSTILRTWRNLRKIGIKEYAHQMQYIGDTKAGTYIASDRYGNKYYENQEEELPCTSLLAPLDRAPVQAVRDLGIRLGGC